MFESGLFKAVTRLIKFKGEKTLWAGVSLFFFQPPSSSSFFSRSYGPKFGEPPPPPSPPPLSSWFEIGKGVSPPPPSALCSLLRVRWVALKDLLPSFPHRLKPRRRFSLNLNISGGRKRIRMEGAFAVPYIFSLPSALG